MFARVCSFAMTHHLRSPKDAMDDHATPQPAEAGIHAQESLSITCSRTAAMWCKSFSALRFE